MPDRAVILEVEVPIDGRAWKATYSRSTPPNGSPIEFWTVSDGFRGAVVHDAPPLGENRDPAHWAVLLEPCMKRTIDNHGW